MAYTTKHLVRTLHGLLILIGMIVNLCISNLANAQLIQTGKWRTHLSYKNTQLCEASNRYVYAASQQGFFRVMMQFGDMEKLGKSEGFNGTEVTALAHDPNSDILFIGYSDGNIDLLKNDQKIINVPGFKSKLLQGDKSILHVSFFKNKALVSTYFGLLVIDLTNYEINDSYENIGPLGTAIPVYSSCIVGDSIYIGTEKGLRFAHWTNSVNLNDYNQWQWAVQGSPTRHLTKLNKSVVYEQDSFVYIYNRVTSLLLPDKRFVARIFTNNFGTHIIRKGEIRTYNGGNVTIDNLNLVVSATQFKDGTFWFCTGFGPGVIKKDLSGEIAYMPDGPDDPSTFRMTQNASQLLVSGGGVSSTFGNTFNNSGFYIYTPSGWVNNLFSPFNTNMYDFTFVQYYKARDWYLAATHSNGMLVIKNNQVINRFDDANSPLKRLAPLNLIKVSGIAEDSKGNLWIANYGSETPLLCFTKSGIWKTFSFASTNIEVKSLIIDNQDRKWMILQSGGLLVFDEGKSMDITSDNKEIVIGTQHGLLSNDILSIKADDLGYVWIGTDQGLNIFSGSSTLFTAPKLDRYIVEQNGNVGYLMGEETINDICVDGGGRKWMATNNGIFLIDPYGQRVIRQFNTDNSPLLSNRVNCIGQINNTGEIFAGTDKGIISYRSDADQASESFETIKIYPNPVPPKFDGLITIEGLTNNAEIKITDATGKLVFQTKANGGKATWNGYRLNGTRPNSGVYIVFAINTDGTETAMGKFIYIN